MTYIWNWTLLRVHTLICEYSRLIGCFQSRVQLHILVICSNSYPCFDLI
ncbi:hypothetical protein RchiOBHm_Chr7g0180491 [Rosa chinensis]|uniref:Uncharacterized protein n=1 Tax=Rosa chinensis TaxID=74649 RepID=A0A2P6P2G2_ROSCH|nr:hypothetical protein RchiOBHm_Chr7g0180491 [Rosa chinensis]